MGRDPFRGQRFPREVMLLAVRWYCRFPLSYQDVADLLAERGVMVDRATVFRWVQKFGPEIARRAHAIAAGGAGTGMWTKPMSALAASGDTSGGPWIRRASS